MRDHALSGKRLYALVGDMTCHFAPGFLETLRRLMQEQRGQEACAVSDCQAGSCSYCDEMTARTLLAEASTAWRRQSIVCRQAMQSLDAILEILQAAHEDEPDEEGEKMLAPQLIDGLLAAGRALAGTTLKALDGTR